MQHSYCIDKMLQGNPTEFCDPIFLCINENFMQHSYCIDKMLQGNPTEFCDPIFLCINENPWSEDTSECDPKSPNVLNHG